MKITKIEKIICNLIARWKWYRMTPEQRKEFQEEAILRVLKRSRETLARNFESALYDRRPK